MSKRKTIFRKEHPNISYAIPVCNEHEELERLLLQLRDFVDTEDEIVIQCDLGNTTPEVTAVIETYKDTFRCPVKRIDFALDADFSKFKNNLKANCSKEYVFQIDADETLGDGLLMHLPLLLKENADIDIFWLPRINIVQNLTEDYARQQNWRVDRIGFPVAKNYDHLVVNYPDVQQRLMRNLPEIQWKNRVHEVISGYRSHLNLGAMEVSDHFAIEDVQNWCLIHIKTIERQRKQNEFYETLIKG